MKALITSDWHPDWVTFGVSRFDEIKRAALVTMQEAIDESCEHYFFLGDLCDPDSGPVVFRCVALAITIATTLAEHQIHSHWLVGNHDVIEDGLGASTLQPIGALNSNFVHLYSQPGIHGYETPSFGAKILVLPFTPTSHTYDPEIHVAEFMAKPGKGIVLSHLSCPGIIPGEETDAMPRGRDVVLPLKKLASRPDTIILNGHYHRQQSHGNLHIPGSLARLTFSEVDYTPSYLLVDI